MDDVALQDSAAVRVAIRVRPLITRELLQGSRTCISTDGPCVTVGRDRRFTFDHAFGPNTQQDHIYREVVAPLVESCFEGFNVTVLAYGQTGSGKTFTMGTGEVLGGGAQHQEEEEGSLGIAPRVIRQVFEGIEARRLQASFTVRAQFLEIYNEDVKDLLLPHTAEHTTKWSSRDREAAGGPQPGGGGGITLRDAGDGTILVVGAVEEEAQCAADLAELLERGMALRATSSTCANEQSSRSHAILTVIIEQHLHAANQPHAEGPGPAEGSPEGGASVACSSGGGAAGQVRLSTDGHQPGAAGPGAASAGMEVRTAKLHLVDLAGSERTKQLRSSMQGPRFRETVNINQGLLALGNVISALGDERRRGSHVPYRESKLTRLLQDSLGGNSRTAMIACVSPADDTLEETLNTLKYANRAKNIRNKPVVNRALPAAMELSPLRGAVQVMQLEVLQQLAAQLAAAACLSSAPSASSAASGLMGGAEGSGGAVALARGLPLAELLALDLAADPAACLDVLGRMKAALAASGASSRAASMGQGSGGGSDDGGGLAPGFAAAGSASGAVSGAGASPADVEALVSGCSRAIAGIMHGLAEMEAQGQINSAAREHILRSLDASTLRLLPAVRSIGPRTSNLGPLPEAAGIAPAVQAAGAAAAGASKGGENPGVASSERERQLEERIRGLEAELVACRAELREAQEDLERDEIIFADKMKELQEARTSSAGLKQRLRDVEERHTREVGELQRQVEALQAVSASGGGAGGDGIAEEAQAAATGGRPAGWQPARSSSGRNRARRASGSGSGSASGSGYLRRRATAVPFTTLRVGDEAGGSSGGGGGANVGEGLDDAESEGRGGEEDEVLYDEELLSYISETDYTEQDRREVLLESDAALREELAEVLREKAAAEAERAALERAALAQRSSFDEARAALEQQLSGLSGSISSQQQLLQAAQAAEREARELAAKWQDRAQELEAAIGAREESLARLRAELEALEGNAQRSAEERGALRQQYEKRIAAVVAQVSGLQRQLQQHAAAASAADRRERQQMSERAAALEGELARLRGQQADLKRQLAERVARYERESGARLRELAALRKAAGAARARMAVLEQENRAQRLLLRAKQQEVAAAEQRLRESQRSGGGAGGGGTRSRSSSPGCRGYLVRGGGGMGSGNGRAASPPPLGCPRPQQGQGLGLGQPQRRVSARSTSLQRLEDIAAEELLPLPLRGSINDPATTAIANGAHTTNSSNSSSDSKQGGDNISNGHGGDSLRNSSINSTPSDNPAEEKERKGTAGGAGQEGEAKAGQEGGQEEDGLAEWAAELLAHVTEAAGVEARLEVLAGRHRDLQGRREALLREQSLFELRTRRRAEQLTQAVAACEVELAELASRAAAAGSSSGGVEGAEPCTPSGSSGPEAEAGGGSRQQQQQLQKEGVAALSQRMAEVGHVRDVLQQRMRSGRLLDDREQQILDSLDDQLDDLETQLSYVAGELADRRAALAQLQRGREALQRRAGQVDAAGLRLALTSATEAVAARAFQVRQLEAALAASEAGAARREAALQFRLRESLVSLSAHIASLEAASPSASVCLDSSELRNLLGIYLDLDMDVGADLGCDTHRGDPLRESRGQQQQRNAVLGATLAADHTGSAPQQQQQRGPQPQPAVAFSQQQHTTIAAAPASVQQPPAAPEACQPMGPPHRPSSSAAGAATVAGMAGATAATAPSSNVAAGAVAGSEQGGAGLGLAGGPGDGEFTSSPRCGKRSVGSSAGEVELPLPRQQQQLADAAKEPVLVQAESLAVWGDLNAQQQPLGTSQRPPQQLQKPQLSSFASASNRLAKEAADLSLQPPQRPPAPPLQPGAAAAPAWPHNDGPAGRMQQQHQNMSLSDGQRNKNDNCSAITSTASLCRCDEGSGGGAAAAAGGNLASMPMRVPSGSQSQPQPLHRRTGSGSGSFGGGGSGSYTAPASPTGGILRRAGSFDSVGSGPGSGTTKRVTWSEHIATDPAAGPPPSPTRTSSGVGGSGRGRERSILDRASLFREAAAARWVSSSGAGGNGGGAGTGAALTETSGPADEAARPSRGGAGGTGEAPPPGRDSRSGAPDAGGGLTQNHSVAATAAAVATAGDVHGGYGNGRATAWTLPRSLIAYPPSRSSADSDDTATALDAAAATSAPEGAGAKLGVRSFNPWRGGGGNTGAAGPGVAINGKQPDPQHQQQQLELPRISNGLFDDQGAACGGYPSPQHVAAGTGGDDRLNGLLPAQCEPAEEGDAADSNSRAGVDAGVALRDSGSSRGSGTAREQEQQEPQRRQQQHWCESLEERDHCESPAAFGGGALSYKGGDDDNGMSFYREPGLRPSNGSHRTSGSGAVVTTAAAHAAISVTEGYDSDEDELEQHVRLLEQAASAAAAAAAAMQHQRPLPPPAAPSAALGQRRNAAAAAPAVALRGRRGERSAAAGDNFGYAVVFDGDPDSDVYSISQGPTPREERTAAVLALARAPRGRFSLDRPDGAAAASTCGGTVRTSAAAAAAAAATSAAAAAAAARSNSSAPMPLAAPVRSISPVQYHYDRQQQRPQKSTGAAAATARPAPPQPAAAAAIPGPFTTPKPIGAMAALSEALQPYKAHLKRSAVGAHGGGASSGIKANFASPQQQRDRYAGGQQQQPGHEDAHDFAPAPHQPPQRHPSAPSQPWRSVGAGQGTTAQGTTAAAGLDSLPHNSRLDKEHQTGTGAAGTGRIAARNARFVS